MDFAITARLRCGGMDDPAHPTPDNDLVRRLFVVLTTRFEDGAAIAAEGQASGVAPDAWIELANRLHALAQEAMIVADAVVAVSGTSDLSAEANGD